MREILASAIILLVLVFPGASFAANTTDNYTGSTSGSLLTTGNWSLSAVPTVANDAVFPSGAATGIRTLTAGNLTVGSFNVLATSGTFSIRNETSTATDSTLTLGGAGNLGNGVSGNTSDLLYAASGSTFNILGPNGGSGTGTLILTLGQSGNINVAGTMAISSAIGGSGFGITKIGAGTLTLSGVNTYTGPTVINQGTLTLSGSINSGSALMLGSGTLNSTITSGTQTFNGTTLNGFGTVTTAASGTVSLGAGTITRNTGGILNISGSGSTTTANAFDSTGILGTWATFGTGTSLKYAAGGSGSAISAYTGTAAATAANVTDTTGAVNYDVAAVGTLGTGASFNTLRYTGAAGTIAGNFTANGLMNAGSGALTYSGNVTIGANRELVIVGNTQGTTISGIIANNGGGASSLTYGGPSAGTLALMNANTYSGGTTISAGTLMASNAAALGTGSVTMQGGTLKVSPGITIGNNIVATSSGGTITVGTANNITLTGTLSGSGNLTLGGSGGGNASVGVTFAANNMTSGTITMGSGNGTPRLKNTASSSSAVDWIFQNGSTEVSGTWNFGSFGGTGNFNAFNNNSGTTIYSIGGANHDSTYSAVLSANGTGQQLSVVKVGTGSQTFSGANSYTGTTTVEDGSLVAGATVNSGVASPFGNASSAIALGDATTISSGTAMNPKLLIAGAFTMARTVTVGANNNSLGNASTTFTLGGNTANSSTFSGAITLNQSLVVTQVTSGTLSISGNITSGSSGTQTMTVNNPGTVNIGTGVIGGGTGTIALTKTGAGTLTLSGANTYTGNTTVSGGTLLVNGSTASGSAASVSGSGNVLGGSGTVNGATTISSSGALTPRPSGGSATTTTFGGNLTLSSASANFTLSTSAAASNDKVVYGSSGTLTLDNSDTINISGTTFDTASDYTLFTSSGGTVSMATTPTLKINGVTSDQTSAGSYQLVVSGSLLKLHYIQAALPPTVNSASASPASLGHYQTTTLTVNVTPQSGQSISSVTVTLDQLGGASDPTTLTGPGGDGTGNWTGTFTVPATLAAGSYTISGSVNQSDATTAGWSVTGITVTNASPTWNGSGADNKWSTGGNWDDGHGPGLGDTVAFAGSTQLTNNLDASVSVISLTFNSGSGSFDITNAASTLTLTGGLTNNSTSTQTLDVPVALSGAQAISAAAGNVTINRALSDSGAGFTLAGGGTLSLSATNTYTGPTTIGSGTLAITGSGSLGSGSYSANITNNGALNYGSSASQTLSGIISGTGSLTNTGSGTLTLSGANTYSGGTTITNGTINFTTATALGTGAVTATGGTLKQSGSNFTTTNNFVVNGPTTLDCVNNWTFNGNISGTGTITRGTAASATLFLNGDDSGFTGTYQDQNNFNAVTRFKNANAGSANAHWIFNNGNVGKCTLDFGSGTISFGSMTGGGTLFQDENTTTKTVQAGALGLNETFSGVMSQLSGTAVLNFTKVGSGTMTLSGANTYTGNTTISNGVLALSGSGTITNSANIILSGATFDVSALSSTFTLGSSETFIATNNATGTIAGSLSLGSGSLVLNYTNGTPSLLVTNGTFTFNNNAVTVTVSGTQLASGSYKLISKATAGNAGLVAGTLPSSVTVNGAGAAFAATLQIIGDELYLVVNHPPVASTMNVTRTAGLSVKIAWSDLATNWTDADADAMSPNSFNLTTTNGVTLQTNGTWILYTNSVNVADQFSYTIIDARGATATGFVNIVINPFVTGQNTTVTVNGGTASVSFYGIPGYSYITQRATNIVTPNWVDISTNTAPGNGAINVTDGFSDLGDVPDSAYYRLKWQP